MASLRFTWPILEPKKKLVNMRLVEIFTRGSLFLWLVRGEKDLLMFCSIKPFFFPFVFSRFYITGSDGEILSGSKNSVSSYHTWVFETTFPLSWRVADIDNYVHRRSKYKRTFQLLDWENSPHEVKESALKTSWKSQWVESGIFTFWKPLLLSKSLLFFLYCYQFLN